jgi:hypothetical protein
MDITPDEPTCDFIHLCARYGTFGKTEKDVCQMCGFWEPNEGANIK